MDTISLDEFMLEMHMDAGVMRARFMNNDMIILKFLRKFLNDKSFIDLKECMEKKDMKGVLCASHTLKGVAANLGLESVRKSAQEMLDSVRAGEEDKLEAELIEVEKAYKQACELIEQLED
jgi:HPt (histidine-containing phosphotransfer) domain-containing protein